MPIQINEYEYIKKLDRWLQVLILREILLELAGDHKEFFKSIKKIGSTQNCIQCGKKLFNEFSRTRKCRQCYCWKHQAEIELQNKPRIEVNGNITTHRLI